MKYETKIIEYDGKFIPLILLDSRYKGVERIKVSWPWQKPKYKFRFWFLQENVVYYCLYNTRSEAQDALNSFVEYSLKEYNLKKELGHV